MIFRSIVIESRFLKKRWRIVINKFLRILFVNYLKKRIIQFSNLVIEFIIFNGI